VAINFSFLMPTYNAERYLNDALQSVVSQKGVSLEVLIADGGSTDRTLAIAAAYADRGVRVVSHVDQGMYDGINKAWSFARGELIWCLNADDRLASNSVCAEVLHFHRAHPKVGIIVNDIVMEWPNGYTETRRHPFCSARTLVSVGSCTPVPQPGTVMRRDLRFMVGSFRTDIRVAADYDFLIRALMVDTVAYSGICTTIFRRHEQAQSERLKVLQSAESKTIQAYHARELGLSAPEIAVRKALWALHYLAINPKFALRRARELL